MIYKILNLFLKKKINRFPIIFKLRIGRYYFVNLEYIKKIQRISFTRNFEEIYIRFKERLNKKKIIVDVGAMDGSMYEYFDIFIDNASYHLIEASPISFEILKKSYISKLTNVKIYNYLISEDEEIKKFYHYKKRKLSGTYKLEDSSKHKFTKNNPEPQKEFKIKAQKLSNIFEEIDILKINTQGSELKILNGSKELLKLKKIKLVLIEYDYRNIYKNENTPTIGNLEIFFKEFDYFLIDIIMIKKFNSIISHGYVVFANDKIK